MLIKLSVFSLFALHTGALWAASIHGKITDPRSQMVVGARIDLFERDLLTHRTTFSNNNGEFDFEALAAGEYRLSGVSKDGSLSADSKVTVGADQKLAVDLGLTLQAIAQRILVTGASNAESVDETAKALDVVDHTLLDKRADYSLINALRHVPGMRVQQLGGPGAFTRIQMRGLRTADTSVLIDGFRLRDTAAPQGDASAFMADLLVMNTDRVEVLRGSGSSLYGTHANAGVVNIVTDHGGGAPHAELDAEGGGLGLFRGTAKLSGDSLQQRFGYSGAVTHLNVSNGVNGTNPVHNSSAQGFAEFRIRPRSTISGRFFGNEQMIALADSPYSLTVPATGDIPAIAGVTFAPAPVNSDSHRDSSFYSTLVSWTEKLSPNTSFRVNYNGLRTSRDNRDGPAGIRFPPAFNNSNRYDGALDTVQARFDAALTPRNQFSAGYEFENEKFDNLATDANPDPARRLRARTIVSERTNAVYVQDQIRLIKDRLLFSVSARMQGFTLNRPMFEGGAPRYQGVAFDSPRKALTADGSLAWFVRGTSTKLRSHVGNSYRAPSLYERFGTSFFGGSFSPLGDPRLRPDRVISFDGGFDQYFANQRIRVSGTAFYTRLQEIIGYDSLTVRPATDPFGRFGGYKNTGGGLARGFEGSSEWNLSRTTRVLASYTYTNSTERFSPYVGGSLRSPRIFRNMFTALLTQRLTKRADFTFDFIAGGKSIMPIFTNTGTRPFLFDGPRTGNATLNYNVPVSERVSLRFYTRIENVFNQTYYADGFPTPKAWAVGGFKLMF